MVLPAPRIAEVLPAFLEFARDAVIVGHNIRFDCAFLDAALVAHGYPRLSNRRVDTRRARAPARPRRGPEPAAAHARPPLPHRASNRCTAPTPTRPRPPRCCTRCSNAPRVRRARASTTSSRCRRCARIRRPRSSRSRRTLPRAPGRLPVPRSRRAGALRRQGDEPARPGALVLRDRRPAEGPAAAARDRRRSTTACAASPFEAEIRELRLIQRLRAALQPRRRSRARRYAYLKLTDERFPRLTVTRIARRRRPSYLGPFHSTATAHLVREAIEDGGAAAAVRTTRIGRRAAASSPGRRAFPRSSASRRARAAATSTRTTYAEFVGTVRRGLTTEPEVALGPLEARMHRLADEERFEEAAATRDRLAALARALQRRRTVAMWRGIDAARRRVRRPASRDPAGTRGLARRRSPARHRSRATPTRDADAPTGIDVAEILTVDRWLARNAGRLRLVVVHGELGSPLPRIARPAARMIDNFFNC